jgi:hypothetical protein
MSVTRADSPWPSMSTVITRKPRAASVGASAVYIRPSINRPWVKTTVRAPSPYAR